jgi:hypothetical protein
VQCESDFDCKMSAATRLFLSQFPANVAPRHSFFFFFKSILLTKATWTQSLGRTRLCHVPLFLFTCDFLCVLTLRHGQAVFQTCLSHLLLSLFARNCRCLCHFRINALWQRQTKAIDFVPSDNCWNTTITHNWELFSWIVTSEDLKCAKTLV